MQNILGVLLYNLCCTIYDTGDVTCEIGTDGNYYVVRLT